MCNIAERRVANGMTCCERISSVERVTTETSCSAARSRSTCEVSATKSYSSVSSHSSILAAGTTDLGEKAQDYRFVFRERSKSTTQVLVSSFQAVANEKENIISW